MTTRVATCSCGQLKIHAVGEPIRVSICHCLECQRRSGGPFTMQARFERPNVTVEGSSKQYVRVGSSGNPCTQSFCPECGNTVFYQLSTQPDVFAVPVGGFADPTFPPPKFSVYEVRKHPWVQVPADAERWD